MFSNLRAREAEEAMRTTDDAYVSVLMQQWTRELSRMHGIVILKAIVGRFDAASLQLACH